MNRRKQKGFTLIELLVVIAIIAILAAILFPVFAKARDKGKQAACLSNLKQIGMSVMMYCQDYDDTYPYAYYTASMTWPYGYLLAPQSGPNTYDGSPWTYRLVPYIKNTGIWFCAVSPRDPGDQAKDPTTGVSNCNYSINSMVVLPDYWISIGKALPQGGPVSLGSVVNPSATFLWEDWGQGYTNGAIHCGGTNFCCCDGHAKWQKQGRKDIIGGWW